MKIQRHHLKLLRVVTLVVVLPGSIAASCANAPDAVTPVAIERPAFAGQTIKAGDALEVKTSREITPADGQIAICIGPLDLSRQTRAINATTFRAEPGSAALPVGQQDVVVHLIRGDQWTDLARFTVTVEGAAGGDTGATGKGLESRFTVGIKGQLHEQVSGTTKAGTRGQFQDLTTTGALNWEGKPLGWDTKTSANLTGASKRSEAPRFGTDGVNAEKLDLNDYKAEFARGDARLGGGQALEEAFVRTFELQPSCSPYAGPHLFGDEGFQRGRMLSSLRAGFERAQFDSKTELPDHVAVLLRFAARIEGPEREELLDWCLATPLVAMEKRLQDSTNPYRHLCRAARILFAANGVPEHVASTLSRTAPPPSDGGCGGTFTEGEES